MIITITKGDQNRPSISQLEIFGFKLNQIIGISLLIIMIALFFIICGTVNYLYGRDDNYSIYIGMTILMVLAFVWCLSSSILILIGTYYYGLSNIRFGIGIAIYRFHDGTE